MPRSGPLRLGVVSDTHGYLDPRLLSLYADVDLILHAGDVGDPAILEALSRLAPVVAVRGNVDVGPGLDHLPESVSVSAGGVLVYMTHVYTPPGAAGPGDPLPAGARVAIFGHSHQPVLEEIPRPDGSRVLYLNPASAGRQRFRNPRLAGLLEIAGGEPRAHHLPLS